MTGNEKLCNHVMCISCTSCNPMIFKQSTEKSFLFLFLLVKISRVGVSHLNQV